MRLAQDTDVQQLLTIEVLGPPTPRGIRARFQWPLTINLMRETEENLTALLPEDYSVRIKEWDE